MFRGKAKVDTQSQITSFKVEVRSLIKLAEKDLQVFGTTELKSNDQELAKTIHKLTITSRESGQEVKDSGVEIYISCKDQACVDLNLAMSVAQSESAVSAFPKVGLLAVFKADGDDKDMVLSDSSIKDLQLALEDLEKAFISLDRHEPDRQDRPDPVRGRR